MKIMPGIKGFICAAQSAPVVCSAPVRCNQECERYNARRLTGMRTRQDKLTAYYEGIYLVEVKP